jgi:hypothetical protein
VEKQRNNNTVENELFLLDLEIKFKVHAMLIYHLTDSRIETLRV